MFKKILSLSTIVCFFLTTLVPLTKVHADTVLSLPTPGTMVNLTPAYVPVIVKGLRVHTENPILFDFIVDTGNTQWSSVNAKHMSSPNANQIMSSPNAFVGDPAFKQEATKLIKYFLASLTIPEDDLWVNLSPYEKNRIIPDQLGQTEMGRDMLAEDYILKQLTASLIYPEKNLGKEFWSSVYAKAQQLYGTSEIPVNTFNKVWIVADKAKVYVHDNTAFVVASHLKVMLEEDYLALQKHKNNLSFPNVSVGNPDTTHSVISKIIRTIILPALEKEVNTGKNFANLRQIFHSMILAAWYKKNLKEALLNQVYSNKAKINGIQRPGVKRPNFFEGNALGQGVEAKQSQQDLSPEQIYKQYLQAYKKGVFNYIKEDTQNGQTIPRKYFSGGEVFKGVFGDLAQTSRLDDPDVQGFIAKPVDGAMLDITVQTPKAAQEGPDAAMGTEQLQFKFTPDLVKKDAILERIGQLVDLMEVIQYLRLPTTDVGQTIDSWGRVNDNGVYTFGPAINLKSLEKNSAWVRIPGYREANFKKGAYALTRILIMSQVDYRRGVPRDVESLYWHWIALPENYFEQTFDVLMEILKDVQIQLKDWGEARLSFPEDEQGQQQLQQMQWILSDLLAPKETGIRVDRDSLEKVAEEAAERAQPESENYYQRLGLSPELIRRYQEEDWEKLIHLIMPKVSFKNLNNPKNRELINKGALQEAAWFLVDPVVRAHYDHKLQPEKFVEIKNPPGPQTFLPPNAAMMGERIGIIAQRVTTLRGARTGEVNIDDAIEEGANGILAGHSEPRKNFRDKDNVINSQILAAHARGLKYITLAVGETGAEKESGKTENVLRRQIRLGLKGLTPQQIEHTVIAYEPRWAISGTDFLRNATEKDAEEGARLIRQVIAELTNEGVTKKVIIQYGGSVDKSNAKLYLSQPNIDGLLVGSKSTSVAEFQPIIEAAKQIGPKEGRISYIGANWKTYEVKDSYDQFLAMLRGLDLTNVRVSFAPSLVKIKKLAQAFSANAAMMAAEKIVPGVNKAALAALPPGGIDLNASNMNLGVSGEKVDIHFDQAMIAQFKRGDFSGVRPEIISITPLASIWPLLGMKDPEEKLAGV